ncbi:MAG TPA: HAD-IA family hydrolase [Candidatus Eisenbacteria bacterium]|nr:HAD-IA family hydrolase [Candidatus Eisenbacteria bacterium]
MIRAIIFDLDNTLTDFMKMKRAAIDAAVDGMLDAGLTLPRDEVATRIYQVYDREGIEYQQVFDRFLNDTLGRIDYKILSSAIVAYRRARDSYLVLYPHVNITLLELLKRGLKLAVVSDAPRLQAWTRLAHLQLHHLFDTIVAFEDTGERKPSPKPFERAIEFLGIAPSEAIMVGDWPERDVVGAAKVGIKTAFARYGDTFGTVHSGADYDLNDVYELVAIVDQLNGRD